MGWGVEGGGSGEKEGMIQGLKVRELPVPFCHSVQKSELYRHTSETLQI